MKLIFIKLYCVLFLSWGYSLRLAAQENNPPNTEAVMKKIVMARVYNKNMWTLINVKPQFVAEILARFKPSYVAGLIHLAAETPLLDAQITSFNLIRERVLKDSPDCKFDFVLNPRQYKKPEDIVAKMTEINQKVKVDIWFLDFYAGLYKNSSKVVEAAIVYAHSQNQLIGGNELSNTIFKNADFVAYTDGFGISAKLKEEIIKTAEEYKIPVLFHINNDVDNSDKDVAHTFVKRWEKHEREEHIKRLSRNQFSWKYRLMYPVFFPVYVNKDAYDISKDDKMIELYLELMGKYN